MSGPDPAVPLVTAATGHRDICGAAGKDKARGHHTDHTSYSTAQRQQLSALRPSPPWRVLFVNIGGFQMQIGSQLTPPANWQACCCAACWHNRLCVRLTAPAVSWHQGSVHKVAGASSVQGYSTEMNLILDANDSHSVLEYYRNTNKSASHAVQVWEKKRWQGWKTCQSAHEPSRT